MSERCETCRWFYPYNIDIPAYRPVLLFWLQREASSAIRFSCRRFPKHEPSWPSWTCGEHTPKDTQP